MRGIHLVWLLLATYQLHSDNNDIVDLYKYKKLSTAVISNLDCNE